MAWYGASQWENRTAEPSDYGKNMSSYAESAIPCARSPGNPDRAEWSGGSPGAPENYLNIANVDGATASCTLKCLSNGSDDPAMGSTEPKAKPQDTAEDTEDRVSWRES
jgi:hypothetical protein